MHQLLVFHYDGKNVGDFLGDASRGMAGYIGGVLIGGQRPDGPFYETGELPSEISPGTGIGSVSVRMNISRVWPTANEFRVASNTALFVICY